LLINAIFPIEYSVEAPGFSQVNRVVVYSALAVASVRSPPPNPSYQRLR